MLGKVLKHDLIATSRYFIPIFLAFVIVSIINKITFEFGIVSSSDNQFLEISSILFLTLYIFSVVAVYVLVYVFITMHFYQTMSGEQGYLTHTLPVKTTTLINGRLLCAAIWQSIAFILVFASFGLLLIGHLTSEEFYMFTSHMNEALSLYSGNAATFWIIIGGTLISSLFASPLMFYVSIALGNLFKKQKIAGSVISFIAIYVIMQICSVILLVLNGYMNLFKDNNDPAAFYSIYNTTMISSLLLCIAFSIAFYIITNYIFCKKLNLE